MQAFNWRHGRSGALWRNRYKSCLVDTDHYLLTVIRYIELNPVRAGMADKPESHRWSSVHTHLGRACDPLLTQHPLYLSLGRDRAQRAQAYATWLRSGTREDELAEIKRHIAQERALRDSRFQRMVEHALNRPVDYRPRGRPRTQPEQVG